MFKLFGGACGVHVCSIGVYVETYEALGGRCGRFDAFGPGEPAAARSSHQVRLEMDPDGAASLSVYTDRPGAEFLGPGGPDADDGADLAALG